MRERLKSAGFHYTKLIPCENTGAVVMDIKGYGGMNNFEQIAASGPSMLLGDPEAFISKNFGVDIASLFFQSARPQMNCSDSWLWKIQDETEQVNYNCVNIWHIEHDFRYSAEQDFLLACRQSGISVKNCSLSEFLDFSTDFKREGQYVYGALTGESLLAMLSTKLPKILDYRSIWTETYKKDVTKLAVILAGCALKNHATLPLPFSIPPSFPCFEQRAHIVMCMDNTEILEQFQLLSSRCIDAQAMKIFSVIYDNQTSSPINGLTEEQLFPLRTSFRVVIFTASEWGSASYFISGGTPGICLGSWPDGECPECIYNVKSLAEALSIAIRLLTDKHFWKTASSRAKFYGRQQFKHFQESLRALFTSS